MGEAEEPEKAWLVGRYEGRDECPIMVAASM